MSHWVPQDWFFQGGEGWCVFNVAYFYFSENSVCLLEKEDLIFKCVNAKIH